MGHSTHFLGFVFKRLRVRISTWRPAIPTDVFRCFPQSLRKHAKQYIKIGHDLLNPFRIIIYILTFY